MEYFEADALCLKNIDYKDNDKLITLYCAEKGKITVTAKGCKSPKSKLKFAVNPLCFGHYYTSVKNNRFTLTGCDCIESFFDLASDIEKYYAAMTIVEFIDKTQMEGEYDNQIFALSLRFLNALKEDRLEDIKKALYLYFDRTSKLLGYKVNAIKLKDYYSYFFNNLGFRLNSLNFIINL